MGGGIPITSPRASSVSSSVARWCFAPPCSTRYRTRSSWPEFTSASRVTGIPEFNPITSAFRQSPNRMTGTPLNRMFRSANTISMANDTISAVNATQ
jgi:hypothetical protein